MWMLLLFRHPSEGWGLYLSRDASLRWHDGDGFNLS